MFPNINTHDRSRAIREWIILIGSRDDSQATAFLTSHAQPEPKRPFAALVNSPLNVSKDLKEQINCFGKFTFRRAASFGSHDFPEHAMVPCAAAVIADSGANILWHSVQIF